MLLQSCFVVPQAPAEEDQLHHCVCFANPSLLAEKDLMHIHKITLTFPVTSSVLIAIH